MKLLRILILPMCALASSASPAPDVDVLVASGSPLDWLSDIPRPLPTNERTRLGTSTVAGASHATLAEEAPHIQATDVYSFARITTVDLIGEIPWTVRDGEATPSAYPPAVQDDVLWLALSVFLRRVLHPAQVNEAEAHEYLAYLGEPSLVAAQMARSEPGLMESIRRIREAVNPIPAARPDPEETGSPIDRMMTRLTIEDLTISHPFSFDQRFAARLSLLGNDSIPFVLQASRSEHSFLHRNAAVMLGRYDDDRCLERLRELLTRSLDLSTRARVVDALVRKRDARSVDLFHNQLAMTRDISFAASLLRGLGILGSRTSLPVLVDWLRRSIDRFDIVVTALTALARIGTPIVGELDTLLRQIRNTNYPDPASSYSPSVPDPAGCREMTIDQLITLVRAAARDKDAAQDLWRLFDQGRKDLDDAGDRRRIRRGTLGQFFSPVGYLALEIAGRWLEGHDRLQKIAHDPREDVLVRVHAIIELARANPPDLRERIEDLASLKEDQPVAQCAFRVLCITSPAQAVPIAQGWLEAYRQDLPEDRRCLLTVAIRHLVSKSEVPAGRLLEIAESELIMREQKAAVANSVQAKQGCPKQNQDQMSFNSPVPFIETIIALLGSMKAHESATLFIDLLRTPDLPARAEAAIALGALRRPEDWGLLADTLEDLDPWVRFMAYRSLKFSLGKDFPCDWIYGNPTDRMKAVHQYREAIDAARK